MYSLNMLKLRFLSGDCLYTIVLFMSAERKLNRIVIAKFDILVHKRHAKFQLHTLTISLLNGINDVIRLQI